MTARKKRPAGFTREYAYRKLAKDRPDLFARVQKGEVSAHAAMVEAGFRKRPTPLEQMRKLWGKLGEGDRATFLKWAEQGEILASL